MAAAVVGELREATLDDVAGLTLEDIRRRLREHARWKILMAERAAVMMIQGVPHHQIREELDVSSEQYRHIRRWLRQAMLGRVEYRFSMPSENGESPSG
jgi:hypothetical protein